MRKNILQIDPAQFNRGIGYGIFFKASFFTCFEKTLSAVLNFSTQKKLGDSMLRTNPFLLLLFCVLFVSPLFAEVVVDPNGFELQEVPTGTSSIEIMTLSNLGDDEVDFNINVEINDEFLAPERDRRGDPDQGGVEWRDNDENDGPVFEWIDISEIGQRLQPGDDWNSGPLNFGWEFTWYDQVYNSVNANSNGWLSLNPDDRQTNIGLPQCPNADAPNPAFCLLNRDINPSAGGEMWFWTNEQDMAVVSWLDTPNWGDNNTRATFQIVYMASGMVLYQYAELLGNLDANIGYESPDGQLGANIGNGGLQAELAIGMGPADAWINWISIDPIEGVIRGGDEFELDVIINTTNLENGDYSASILIETSEGENLEVSVDLNVVGGPAIFSEIQEWNFGDVYVGSEVDAAIPVENIGQEELVIDEIASNNPDVFYAEDAPDGGWVIAPGEVIDVIIHVTPAAQGDDEGVLVVNSNAVNFPEVPFGVSVNGSFHLISL